MLFAPHNAFPRGIHPSLVRQIQISFHYPPMSWRFLNPRSIHPAFCWALTMLANLKTASGKICLPRVLKSRLPCVLLLTVQSATNLSNSSKLESYPSLERTEANRCRVWSWLSLPTDSSQSFIPPLFSLPFSRANSMGSEVYFILIALPIDYFLMLFSINYGSGYRGRCAKWYNTKLLRSPHTDGPEHGTSL